MPSAAEASRPRTRPHRLGDGPDLDRLRRRSGRRTGLTRTPPGAPAGAARRPEAPAARRHSGPDCRAGNRSRPARCPAANHGCSSAPRASARPTARSPPAAARSGGTGPTGSRSVRTARRRRPGPTATAGELLQRRRTRRPMRGSSGTSRQACCQAELGPGVIDLVGAVRAAQHRGDPVALAQRADLKSGLAAGRDERPATPSSRGSPPQRPPGQHGCRLRERLERERGRQHRHAVDPVIGQVRIAGEGQPGRADELDARVVDSGLAQEPPACRQARGCELAAWSRPARAERPGQPTRPCTARLPGRLASS